MPTVGPSMDTALSGALAVHGLEEIQPKLSQMGVEKLDDISYLTEIDLLSAGLTLLQVRKLQAAHKGQFENTHEGEQDGAAGAGTHGEKRPPAGGSPVSSWMRISEDGAFTDAKPLSRILTSQRRDSSSFWGGQKVTRPLRLVFVRHGQSEGNMDRSITASVPDHMLHLTRRGRQDALEAGRRLKALVGDESIKFVVSPYVRTRETLNGILQSFASGDTPNVKEDVRIREQEFGNFDHPDIASMHKEKRKFGAFYYRFPEGESPADLYDRASLFLESMYRSWGYNTAVNEVVVCHGMMITVILLRLLRFPIEEFENLEPLENGEFVVLERPSEDAKYQIAFTWAPGQEKEFRGLRRKAKDVTPRVRIWDGSPDAPLLSNTPVTSEK